MQKLAEVCIRRPVFAAMLVLALVVVGGVAYRQLGVDRFPAVDIPQVRVRAILPGAAAEETETEIAQRLEEAVNTVEGLDELRSISGSGAAVIAATFQLSRDVDVAVSEVSGVVLKNIDDLRSVIDSHHERRLNDIPKVKKLIIDGMVEFLVWYYSLPIMPDCEKTGTKPPPAITYEILQVKQFLNQNLSEIHRLAAKSGGDFYEDLNSHFSLIHKLRSLKAETLPSVSV